MAARDAFGGSNLLTGKCEEKFGALAGFRLDPHAASVALHDLVTDRQTYSAPGIFAASVKALKQTKHLFVILSIDPNPVIYNPSFHIPQSFSAEIWIRGGASLRYLRPFPMRF